jgi:bacteriorhodopsin
MCERTLTRSYACLVFLLYCMAVQQVHTTTAPATATSAAAASCAAYSTSATGVDGVTAGPTLAAIGADKLMASTLVSVKHTPV